MKSSIIVPVYNLEKYIGECIESLLRQKGEIEIILVDNNSTDGSRGIIEEYAKKDKRIKLIEEKKWGAAAARNAGVKAATGKYLWFVDGDDWIEEGAIEKLERTVRETGAEVVIVGFYKNFEDGRRFAQQPFNKQNWRKKIVWYGAGPWEFYVQRKWLVEQGMWFPEGMMHEDIATTPTYGIKAGKVEIVEEGLYDYRQRKGSVLHQEKFNRHQLDIFRALTIVEEKFREAGKYEEYREEIEFLYIWHLISDAAKEFMRFRREPEAREGLRKIRKMMRKRFPKWRKNKYFKERKMLEKVRFITHYYGVGR